MWIITKDGVAINSDHISKLYYRQDATMAKVDGQTTIIATGNQIRYILGAIQNKAAAMDFVEVN